MQISFKDLYFIAKREDIANGLVDFPNVAFTSLLGAIRNCPDDCEIMTAEEVKAEIAKNIWGENNKEKKC